MPKRVLKKIHHYTIPYHGNNHHPHTVRHKTLAFYSGLIILVKIIIVGIAALAYPTAAEFSTITTNHIINLSNQARVDNGLPKLKMSETLNQAAMLKAQDMMEDNYFAHTSPDGDRPWQWFKDVQYEYTYAGENLAMNFSQAEDAVDAWMNSPSHRDNILSSHYQDIGVAVVVGELEGDQTTLVVQLFGKSYLPTPSDSFKRTQRVEGEITSGPVEVSGAAEHIEVELKESKKKGWIGQITYYGQRLIFIILVFVAINLLLTIIIRIKVQHKPVIIHCILVLIIASAALLWKAHFIEGLGGALLIY